MPSQPTICTQQRQHAFIMLSARASQARASSLSPSCMGASNHPGGHTVPSPLRMGRPMTIGSSRVVPPALLRSDPIRRLFSTRAAAASPPSPAAAPAGPSSRPSLLTQLLPPPESWTLLQSTWGLLRSCFWPVLLIYAAKDAVAFVLHRLGHRLTNWVAEVALGTPISQLTNPWFLFLDSKFLESNIGYQAVIAAVFFLCLPLNILINSYALAATMTAVKRKEEEVKRREEEAAAAAAAAAEEAAQRQAAVEAAEAATQAAESVGSEDLQVALAAAAAAATAASEAVERSSPEPGEEGREPLSEAAAAAAAAQHALAAAAAAATAAAAAARAAAGSSVGEEGQGQVGASEVAVAATAVVTVEPVVGSSSGGGGSTSGTSGTSDGSTDDGRDAAAGQHALAAAHSNGAAPPAPAEAPSSSPPSPTSPSSSSSSSESAPTPSAQPQEQQQQQPWPAWLLGPLAFVGLSPTASSPPAASPDAPAPASPAGPSPSASSLPSAVGLFQTLRDAWGEAWKVVPEVNGMLARVWYVDLLFNIRAMPLQALSMLVVPLYWTLPRLLAIQLAVPSAIAEGLEGKAALDRSAQLMAGFRRTYAWPFTALILGIRLVDMIRTLLLTMVPPRWWQEVIELPLLLILAFGFLKIVVIRLQDVMPAAAFLWMSGPQTAERPASPPEAEERPRAAPEAMLPQTPSM